MALPAQALTSNTRIPSTVRVTDETACTGVFEVVAQPYTGLFCHADPVNGIDPSGHENITALLNTNQLIVGKYLYDPFGNLLAMSGPLAPVNVMRFSSKPVDLVSGDYDFGFRHYSTALQRWLNRDPIGELGGLNLYGYVGNDPVNNTDPYGLWIGTTLFRIYKVWRESGPIKRELVREIKNKNLRDSMKEMKDTLDSIDPNRYKRAVEAENGVSAEGIAEKLSKNKQCRGPEGKPPYNKHYNPETGPYKDVHVEPGFSQFAAMALIPHAYEASNTEGITTGEFSATAAWDVLNGIDPVGVTDLMEWLFIK
jgi:RHS repeat-associated protein